MLTIVYDPEGGRACPDGHIESLADGAVGMALEFGSHRIVTSTGAVIDAIIDQVILGRLDRELVRLVAFGHTWKLTPYVQWIVADHDPEEAGATDWFMTSIVSWKQTDWPATCDVSSRRLRYCLEQRAQRNRR